MQVSTTFGHNLSVHFRSLEDRQGALRWRPPLSVIAMSDFIKVLKKNDALYSGLKRQILTDLDSEVVGLTSRTVPFQSVMLKKPW